MTLYVILHEDRHFDPAVFVFATLAAASARYDEILDDYEDAEEEPVAEWLRHHRLSEEGDALRLSVETLLD